MLHRLSSLKDRYNNLSKVAEVTEEDVVVEKVEKKKKNKK